MTRQQFDKAMQIAKSTNLENVDDSILDGSGLPGFKPVTVTLQAAAKFIKWHCMYLNGQWGSEELNEMREISKKRWLIVEG